MTKNHSLNVGDILVSSWGYDQTNVDFYQVVAVLPASVRVREIKSTVTENGFMCGTSTPCKDDFKGPAILRRVGANGWIGFCRVKCAGPWDGKPRRCSWYA